jgi:hypothetical protein
LLLQLAADHNPTVAAAAGRRLLEIDAVLLKPLLNGFVKSPDTGLRQLAARALAELRTPEAVALLGPLLDDPHRDLRIAVRESLIKLAGLDPLKEPVRRAVTHMLAIGGPRGLEQAVMVVGAIRYEPAAARLLQLLDNRHFQVNVPTAWALRRLAVPATAAPILKRVQATVDVMLNAMSRNPAPMPPGTPAALSIAQMEHLLEALGVMRHLPAAPLLRQFLPIPPPPGPGPISPFWVPEMRAAAIWSLGHIYAAEPPADLATLFRDRLINAITPDRENDPVRAIMTINLGRMKWQDAVPTLRQHYEDANTGHPIRRASAWALEQITGKPLPRLQTKPRGIWHGDWFLVPLDS